MPITPLHFGLLAPINYVFPNKVSNVSFILTTLWIDGNSILYALFNLPGEAHGWNHTFIGALCLAMLVCLIKPLTLRWVTGAFLGAVTHVLLDMLVHAEMLPWWPASGNFAYMGWMVPVSLALLPLLIWLIVQYVSCILGWMKKYQEG